MQMIENYILHEQIGQGEYGKVYRATDTSTQSTFAVKIVEIQKLNQNPKLLELSLTEIKVLQQVSHCPYIVHFIQLIKTPTQYCFVYEYCSGGPLDKMLSLQGHLYEQKALQILWQLLQAFKILYLNRIMHRDLKPSNILIQNGTYKLADFGFCKPMEERLGDVTTTMLGSPIYMAPEVLRGLSYDNKADVWSLGAVLYELLVGKCPFEEKSIAKLISAQDDSDWQIPHQFQFKPQTHALLKSMLVKDPLKRCSWEYLFAVPLNKDGEFTNGVLQYQEPNQIEYQIQEPCKIQIPLQSIDNNINYNKDHQFTSFQQYSLPYSPRLQQLHKEPVMKEALTRRFQKEMNSINSPRNIIDQIRDNKYILPDQSNKHFDVQIRNLTRANTFSIPQEIFSVTELQSVFQPSPHNLKVLVKEEVLGNVLTEVIKERNKIYFQCKTLNDVNTLNLLEKSSITGYWILLLLNRRYQCLLKVIKNYLTVQEFPEYPSLNMLSMLLQKRNNIKKLVNNFEFVRLVDTVEKESTAIFLSINEYKIQLDQVVLPIDSIEQREQTLAHVNIKVNNQNILSVISHEQIKQIGSFLISYYYLAFIDFKNESDKHILLHALQILDSLQIDKYFLIQGDRSNICHKAIVNEVVEEFDNYDELDKRQLNDKFEELLKRLTPSPF